MGRESDLDAAERALGTIPKGRETTAQRRARERWEQRLASGLLAPVEGVQPPPGLFARISERLAHDDTRAVLRKSRARERRWRGVAVLTSLMAATVAAVAFLPRAAEPARYVAVVTSDATGDPGMVVEFDTASGLATVIPLGLQAPDGQVYQMWHLPSGADAPYSIGFLPDATAADASVRPGPGDVFGLSVEQPGGSPTGLPTDATYHGTIVEVE